CSSAPLRCSRRSAARPPAPGRPPPRSRASRRRPAATTSRISRNRWKRCRSASPACPTRTILEIVETSSPAVAGNDGARSRRAARRRPRPLERGEPDQLALQVVAAPLGQELGGLLVLHPFGDGLKAEALGEVDQRAHEGAVVLRAGQVLHEG